MGTLDATNTGRTYDAPEHPEAERVIVHVETPTGGYAPGGWPQNYQARRYTIADWDSFVKDTRHLLGTEDTGHRCVARNEYGDVLALHVFG